jgi:hypothetical protein
MSIEKAILEELNEIKKGFKDAEDMDGYDLANEKFHLLNAIALVKKLTIPDVVGQSEQLCDCKKHSIKTNYGFEVCAKCGNEFDD